MKQSKKLLVVLALLALLLIPARSAYAWNRTLQGQVVFGQDFTLKSGDTLNGDLVVIGGQATIEDGAQVTGNVAIIGGSLSLDGQVSGDAVVIGGLVTMGEKSRVAGDVVTMGGTLQRATGAEIGGNIVTNLPAPDVQVPVVPNAPVTPSITIPPVSFVKVGVYPLGSLGFMIALTIALPILSMLVLLFLEPQTGKISQVIVGQPVLAGAMGILTLLVAPVAAVILFFTLILSPISFVIFILLAIALLLGLIAIGLETGQRFTKMIHREWPAVLSGGFGSLLLMVGLSLLSVIPCLGISLLILISLIGIGAVVMTLFGTRPVLRPVLPPPPPSAPAATPGPLPPAS